MKKLVSLISALTMCAVMAAPIASSAAEEDSVAESTTNTITQESSDQTAERIVKYTPTEAYIVTIPESVTVDSPIEVNASGVCLEDGKCIKLSVESEGELTYKSDAIAYTITGLGDGVIVKAGEEGGDKILDIELDEEATPKYANEYTDTITFTVAVEDTPVTDDNGSEDEGKTPVEGEGSEQDSETEQGEGGNEVPETPTESIEGQE